MYRLVIAEKPSVAQSIAKVLGSMARKEGYMEGSGWLVSWCVGHLAGLAEPGVYNPAYDKWRKEDLPIVPENWHFTIGKDKRKQFDALRTLMRREDVCEVVNACDAGREGELIFRTVYHLAGCDKPVKRLWISSMEDSAVWEGFETLRPGSEYDGLHQAALCRLKADWVVGINATRLFSVLYGRTLNVGRVMSPTLAMIVQREAEIAAFEPQPFYTVELSCGGMVLSGERFLGKQYTLAVADFCADKPVTIQTVERREKSEKAPALYDLTTLQREANRVLGYTAQQTLDYLQNLYEKKLCTYPRTDSRYLTDDMEKVVPDLVRIASTICGVKAAGTISAAQVCSSKKVSDHYAIVPALSAAGASLDALPKGEHEILCLVSLSLLRAVCPPCRYAETTVTAECGGHPFTAKGKMVLDMGWRSCADRPQNAALPDGLTEGQTLAVDDIQIKTGTTTPPKHYTEDSILASMESAGARDMPEDMERRGIGTPATRAGILEKLIASGLVERKKAKKIGRLRHDDFFHVNTARVSHYRTKDGAELDAFVAPDDKVYLGRRDHYDNRGHYLNHDKSLLHVSDNPQMFRFISGTGYTETQAELLEEGYFTPEDYAEYAALQTDVLSQFEEAEPLLFGGEPFCFIPLDPSEVNLDAPVLLREDTALDEYPMPDPAYSKEDVDRDFACLEGYLLPLSKERAEELMERDFSIYAIVNEYARMVFDLDELNELPPDTVCAMPTDEWEGSADFRQAAASRMERQEEREQAFLRHAGDCFAIYQLRQDDSTRYLRYEPLERIQQAGESPRRENYELAYTGELAFGLGSSALERLWDKFNNAHPADYLRPSMSVSDIIAVKQDGVVSCHYCDSMGFARLFPAFSFLFCFCAAFFCRFSSISCSQSLTGAFQGSLLLGMFLIRLRGFSPSRLARAISSLFKRHFFLASAHIASLYATMTPPFFAFS